MDGELLNPGPGRYKTGTTDDIGLGDLVWAREYVLLVVEVDRDSDPGYVRLRCQTGAQFRIPAGFRVWLIKENEMPRVLLDSLKR